MGKANTATARTRGNLPSRADGGTALGNGKSMDIGKGIGKSVAGTGLARRLRTAAFAAVTSLALAGCFQETFQKGYILPEGALEQVPIGATQDQVLIVLGTPSTVATLDGEVFYYISERSERKVAFMRDKVVDQRVIAVYFDKSRHVRRLANYGIQDGKIFDFIGRATPTSGNEMSYLTYVFKAFGS